MKSIGFIDYYISEWHANNYPAWFKKACEETGLDYEVKYAWAEKEISPVDGVSTDKWCTDKGVIRCNTIEELCEKSDAIIILCPCDPKKHLEYARVALPYGKPTYIDKPFADCAEDAKEMFAIAEKHGTPFFSTSALRFATELDEAYICNAVSTLGGGSNLEEYIIHQIEMAVKKLGTGAVSLKAQEIGKCQYNFTVKYNDERKASIHFAKGDTPFAVAMSTDDAANVTYRNISSNFFYMLIKDILNFFQSKTPSFDTTETLEVNKILVAMVKAKSDPDKWIEI